MDASAKRTTFSAFGHSTVLRGGVWRFAYTPYEASGKTIGADGGWLVAGWRTPSDVRAGVVVQDEGYGFGRVFGEGVAGVDGGSGGCGKVAGLGLAGFALVRIGGELSIDGVAVLRAGAGAR